jgi:hypothetical protein
MSSFLSVFAADDTALAEAGRELFGLDGATGATGAIRWRNTPEGLGAGFLVSPGVSPLASAAANTAETAATLAALAGTAAS